MDDDHDGVDKTKVVPRTACDGNDDRVGAVMSAAKGGKVPLGKVAGKKGEVGLSVEKRFQRRSQRALRRTEREREDNPAGRINALEAGYPGRREIPQNRRRAPVKDWARYLCRAPAGGDGDRH